MSPAAARGTCIAPWFVMATRASEVVVIGRALVLQADVADAVAVQAAAALVEESLGPIDVWVNNAMVSVFSPVDTQRALVDDAPSSLGRGNRPDRGLAGGRRRRTSPGRRALTSRVALSCSNEVPLDVVAAWEEA